ncbi:MAG: tetratricopeptide repeat protein [Idiomarina sp.]|nr:tetratricopeptide repeat protein [Idiomarina sp.]
MEHEDQQVEQVKTFIKEYGPWVLAGLVIGFGSLFSWRTYQGNQVMGQENRTAAYQQVMEQLQRSEGLDDTAFADDLLAELDGTPYAALTRLQLARKAVEAGDLDQAAELLSQALREMGRNELTGMIALRLARVEIARGDYSAAEAALNRVPDTGYSALKAEVRGDLLHAQGDYAGARAAYQSAVTLAEEGANPFLQMKLDNLAAVE